MSYLLFAIVIAVVIAGIIAIFMFVEAMLAWLHLRLLKEHSVETTARILHVEVLNESNRHIPFVKLQIEVDTEDGHCFISEAESFFPKYKLSTLLSDKSILIRYNPHNISQVQVIKEIVPVHKKVNNWKLLKKNTNYQWLN